MAQRFIEPIARIFTNAGAVGVGYKYYFYETGTTTPVTTYQDEGLSVANTNPVISDSNGRFPEIWYSDLSQLKLIVKDANNNIIEGDGADPVGSPNSAVSLNDFDVRPTSYWGITDGTSTAFTLAANPAISSYNNTQTFVIQPHVDCGDNPTIAINDLAALNWKKYTQQGTKVSIKANDLRASQRYFCINDGVDIVCLNPSSLPILSGSATPLTIATGIITLTNNSSSYVINTEGSASTDDLETINGGQDGQIILLTGANSSRKVVVKNGTGNILLNKADYTLEGETNILSLVYKSSIASWVIYDSSRIVQITNTQTGAFASGVTTVANDDNIMQNTEGNEFMTHNHTPQNSSNILYILVSPQIAQQSSVVYGYGGLFKNSDVAALATSGNYSISAGNYNMGNNIILHKMIAGTTLPITFKYRAGSTSGTMEFNGTLGARKKGGVMASSITVIEVKA